MDHSNNEQHGFWLRRELPEHRLNQETYRQLRSIWNYIQRHFMIFTSRNMKYELLRLLSLLHFPRSSQQDIRSLAIAGFYYYGDGDTAICYCCGLWKRNWMSTDDPINVHRRLSCTCVFLLRNSEVNIRYYSTSEGGFRPLQELTREIQVRLMGPMIVQPAEMIQFEFLATVRFNHGTRVWGYEGYEITNMLPIANLPTTDSASFYRALGIVRSEDSEDNEMDALESQEDTTHESNVYSIQRTSDQYYFQRQLSDNFVEVQDIARSDVTQFENSMSFQNFSFSTATIESTLQNDDTEPKTLLNIDRQQSVTEVSSNKDCNEISTNQNTANERTNHEMRLQETINENLDKDTSTLNIRVDTEYTDTHNLTDISISGNQQNARRSTSLVPLNKEHRNADNIESMAADEHQHSPTYFPENEDNQPEEQYMEKQQSSRIGIKDAEPSVMPASNNSDKSNEDINAFVDMFLDIGELRKNEKITTDLSEHVSTAKDQQMVALTEKIESKPKNKSTKENRLRSFRNNSVCPAGQLTDAGFDLAGHTGYVRCHSCGIEFETESVDQYIWIQHAKASKTCEYVLQKKGHDFVQDVLEGKEEILRTYMQLFDLKTDSADRSESDI